MQEIHCLKKNPSLFSIQSTQSMTFLLLAFFFSWTCIIGGYFGGFTDKFSQMVILVLAMMGPALSALLCTRFFEGSLKSLPWRPSFKPTLTLWWLSAWLIPVLIVAFSMVLTLWKAPDAHFQLSFQGTEIGPLILVQALFLGPLINMPLLTFSEELGWRGYLYKQWRPFGFWVASILTGFVWGLWHAPAIFFYGHNYPEYPVLGIAFFTLWCILVSPCLTLVREKTGSVWAAGLFHGTINALGGLSLILLGSPSLPWKGLLGIGGFIALILSVIFVIWTKMECCHSTQCKEC